ncbi:hypothetical protein Q7P37_011529 [Cladosporium fusiforme]
MEFRQHYPEELFAIKCFLIRKQYHQCIKACLEVLKMCEDDLIDNHPLSTTFATFYLALAHDELARSMHEQSSFKLPTFTSAEQHYRQAIKILPTVEECRSMLIKAEAESDNATNLLSQSPHSTISSEPSEPSVDVIELPPPSTPPTSKQATHNKQPAPPSPKESDFSDTDSHDSFDDIMTPHRILKRDASRMSLLGQPLQRDYSSMSLLDIRPRLDKSVSQGLLRPIRPGSPPRQYHLPPKLPYSGHSLHHINIPKLHLSPPRVSSAPLAASSLMGSRQDLPQSTPSPSRRLLTRMEPENGSPVSSLASEMLNLEVSFTSPVSPQTPPLEVQQSVAVSDTTEAAHDTLKVGPSADLTRLAEHLSGMRTQIQTHITLLQRAKLATTVAQAERASRSATSTTARLDGVAFSGDSKMTSASKRLTQSKSFWSFTPVDVKAAERKKRIEEGRANGWERKRYRSERYVALAEKALSEL